MLDSNQRRQKKSRRQKQKQRPRGLLKTVANTVGPIQYINNHFKEQRSKCTNYKTDGQSGWEENAQAIVYKKLTLHIKTDRPKVKRWRKIWHTNINGKKTGIGQSKLHTSLKKIICRLCI